MGLEFGNLYVLLSLIIIPVFYFLYKKYVESKKSTALKFSTLLTVKASANTNFLLRKHLPFILMITSMGLIIVGLSEPTYPLENIQEGVNVVLVIDGSGSMSAEDYYPTRLEAAKNAAEILINSLSTNDHAGVIVFADGATTASYLSPFKEKTISDLHAIEQTRGSTALGDGLALGVDMASSIPNKNKVVILLSDGEHNAGFLSPDDAIGLALIKNIQVNTIAMGSSEPVLLAVNPISGQPTYAGVDEDTLIKIAHYAGGKFYKSVDNSSLEEIFSTLGDNIDREVEQLSIKDWFFIPAVVLLALNVYIIYGRYKIIA